MCVYTHTNESCSKSSEYHPEIRSTVEYFSNVVHLIKKKNNSDLLLNLCEGET